MTRIPQRLFSALAYLLLTALPAGADSAPATPATPTKTPAGNPCAFDDPENRVGAIEVDAQNIFDLTRPGENHLLFRLANRLHPTTWPDVIRQQLAFRPGDPYSPSALEESERILRANHYIYDAHVKPVRCHDHQVDVAVLTRDVWTLQAGVNFHRAGGSNSSSFELQDVNFLGSGKSIDLAQQRNVDRTTRTIGYRDPNLFGSRVRLKVTFSDNSDGRSQLAILERPFYSLNARWATGFQGISDHRVDSLYDAGRITDQFRHKVDFAEVYGGISDGLVQGHSKRWLLGFTVDRHEFSAPTPGTSLLPTDRKLAYPWIGYQWIEDGFTTERDLDRLQRTEDFNLGRQANFRLGWSSPALGGDRDRLIGAASASAGWRPTRKQLLLGTFYAGGRYSQGQGENAIVSSSLRFYARDWGESVTFVNLEGVYTHRLDPESQVLLGGDNGLRGYPLRFERGDRRLVVNLEQRFYSDRELFHLIHLGGAVFFDAGRAWFGRDAPGKQPGILKDVGAGLRIGSSRSARGSVVHLDVAFPLDAGRSIQRAQWLVSTSESF